MTLPDIFVSLLIILALYEMGQDIKWKNIQDLIDKGISIKKIGE